MSTKQKYKTLANAVFVLHIVVIAMLLGGGFLAALLGGWYKQWNVIFVSTVIFSQILFLGCPLTTLEMAFRRKGDSSIEYGGSLTRWLFKRVFKHDLPPIIVALILGLILVGNIIYYVA